jgi:hypothetical protein
MTTQRLVLAFASCSLSLLVGVVGLGAAQKPTRVVTLEDTAGHFRTLEDAVRRTPIVIAGTVRSSRPDDSVTRLQGAARDVVRIGVAVEIQITRVFKPAGRQIVPGSVITVRMPGGERDRGEYVEAHKGMPTLSLGRHYVLFLRGSPAYSLGLANGADSVFDVSDAQVKESGQQPVSSLARGLTPSAFFARLSELAGVQ